MSRWWLFHTHLGHRNRIFYRRFFARKSYARQRRFFNGRAQSSRNAASPGDYADDDETRIRLRHLRSLLSRWARRRRYDAGDARRQT